MNLPEGAVVAHVEHDASYLPLPNRVELVLTSVPPPADLTPTSFVIGVTESDDLVMTIHSERGLEITGGHVDPGETPGQAARREGSEEAGAVYGTLWPIGYLRCISGGTVPHDHPYPHPVGYQALFAAAVESMDDREDYLECVKPAIVGPDEFAGIPGPLGVKLPMLREAALKALSRDRSIADLATDARPTSDEDWGTERQNDAENRFFDECRRRKPVVFADDGDFSEWCLKSTSEERIDEAMRLLEN